jgi:hypothetical protein
MLCVTKRKRKKGGEGKSNKGLDTAQELPLPFFLMHILVAQQSHKRLDLKTLKMKKNLRTTETMVLCATARHL